MASKKLLAEDRKTTGRKVKQLRAIGWLPGNVYGKKVKSTSVQVNYKEFVAVYNEVGETGLLDLTIGKDVKPVLVHSMQKNAKTDQILHVDFLQVDLKVKVTAEVPVELVGESPAEKQGLGTVVQQINEIEVEALPTDLPEKFEVSIENLSDIDQAVYVKDLSFNREKIEVKADMDAIVVKVEPPQKEEEPITPVVPVGAEGVVSTETSGESQNGNGPEAPVSEPQK
jgi:large subunit ribosomal protein L25